MNSREMFDKFISTWKNARSGSIRAIGECWGHVGAGHFGTSLGIAQEKTSRQVN
jgi:hypothetical protein